MPKTKNEYYDDVKFIKHKRKVPFGIMWALLPLGTFLVVILALFAADMLHFRGLNILSTTAKTQSMTYYALSFGVYDSEASAQNTAELCIIQGGAGYVLHDSAGYHVLGGVYYTRDECQLVADRITGATYEPEVYPIMIKDVKFSGDNADEIKSAYSMVSSIISGLYDISINLDEKKLSPTSACTKILKAKSDCTIAINSLNKLDDLLATHTTNFLLKVVDSLDSLQVSLLGSSPSSQPVRYACVYLACELHDFAENI